MEGFGEMEEDQGWMSVPTQPGWDRHRRFDDNKPVLVLAL